MRVLKGTKLLSVVLFVTVLFGLLEFHNYSIRTYVGNPIFTNTQIHNIYTRLAINSGQQDIPPLIILKSDIINAWTDGTEVVITTSLLSIIENEDELAMILGHEIAHAINHDVDREDGRVIQTDVEAHADKLGAFIMMRAGFDACKGKEIFAVFKKHFGDTSHPVGHPDFAYRLDQLNLPQCN